MLYSKLYPTNCYYLWIQPHFFVRLPCNGQALHEDVDARSLASSTWSQDHDPVPDSLGFVKLNQLNGPCWMVDQLSFINLVSNGLIQIWISNLVQLHVWEQVVDQGQKQGLVLVDQFGQVHVSQNSHHNRGLAILGIVSFCGPKGSQD